MYCVYLRKRKNKPFCKLLNKEITFVECSANNSANNCKEYKKCTKITKNSAFREKKSLKMAKRSKKAAKADRNRFSIIVDNLSVCCFPGCECNIEINKHEIFYGSYRHNSIKYGLVIPLCEFHHTKDNTSIHKDRQFDLNMKFLAQNIFVKKYSLELFIKEFGMDYIEKYRKRN